MSYSEDMNAAPARLSIVNLSTNVELVAQLNPAEFETEIGSDWNRLSPPGASHQRMHFQNTQNYVPTMDLLFRAYSTEEYDEINRARHLMESWCYPQGSTAAGPGKGPPQLLATWPQIFSIVCYLTRCRIRFQKFAPDGRVTRFVASVQFEETRDTGLTSDQVALVSVVRGEL